MTTPTHTLSSQGVQDTVLACLYRDSEMDGEGKVAAGQPDPILIKGVVTQFGFHPERVAAQESRIREMLGELPSEFSEGHSFLVACDDKHGNQWGSHLSMDMLFCLGMAIGAVEYCTPRDLWAMLPGGMPYLKVSP